MMVGNRLIIGTDSIRQSSAYFDLFTHYFAYLVSKCLPTTILLQQLFRLVLTQWLLKSIGAMACNIHYAASDRHTSPYNASHQTNELQSIFSEFAVKLALYLDHPLLESNMSLSLEA